MTDGYDLRAADYWQFTDFFFNRPIDNEEPWYIEYFDRELFDPSRSAGHYKNLFGHSTEAIRDKSDPQIEQGFQAITSEFLEVSVARLIWNENVELSCRLEMIAAMYDIFRDLFSTRRFEHASWMWWDNIADCFTWEIGDEMHPSNRHSDWRKIQDCMSATLARILALPETAVQRDALHGFNHLRHPDTEPLLRRYLSDNPQLSDENVAFVEACIAGKYM